MTEGTCNVLRTFREVDVSPVSPNSTTRIRDIALRNGTLDRNAGRDSERVVRTFRETHAISAMASSTTGCEQKRSETMTVLALP